MSVGKGTVCVAGTLWPEGCIADYIYKTHLFLRPYYTVSQALPNNSARARNKI